MLDRIRDAITRALRAYREARRKPDDEWSWWDRQW